MLDTIKRLVAHLQGSTREAVFYRLAIGLLLAIWIVWVLDWLATHK